LVTGATGAQGGSLAYALLHHGHFTVRAFVRNPEKPEAIKLKEAGAEIAVGTFDDVNSFKHALNGVEAVFLVTNFWEVFHREVEQAKPLIEAIKEAKVAHLVYSGLENVRRMSNDKWKVPHFTQKGELEDVIKHEKIPFTFVHAAFYMENLKQFFRPTKEQDGTLLMGIPSGDSKIAMLAIKDFGPIVAHIFNNRAEYLGKEVIVASDHLTLVELSDQTNKTLGVKLKPSGITVEAFKKLGFPAADDLGDMFGFLGEYQPYKNGPAECKKIYPQLTSFQEWVKSDPCGWKTV